MQADASRSWTTGAHRGSITKSMRRACDGNGTAGCPPGPRFPRRRAAPCTGERERREERGNGVGLVGGWSLDGIARVQSGTTLDFGNVRLVGMSTKELQDSFKLRFDDAGKLIYMLPQDIIDNTVRAFSTSGTSATGYSDQGVPEGRYMAPANNPDCIEIAAGRGDCGVRSLVVTGPTLFRFDLSTSKRIAIKGSTNVEFRAEFLNAFNTPWFEAVATASNNPNNYRVTDADSGRTIQFVFRVNW